MSTSPAHAVASAPVSLRVPRTSPGARAGILAGLRRLGIVAAVSVVSWAALWALGGLVKGAPAWGDPLAPAVSASLIGLSVLGYIGWPSRWNIPAHMQLAFSITAYLLPTVISDSFDVASRPVFELYGAIIVAGFAASAVGAVVGAGLPVPKWADLTGWVERVPVARIPRRVLTITAVSCLVLIGAFVVIGFVPAFVTSDPLAAKFFRGVYAARYAPVAPFYRSATSILGVLMPLVAAYAVWRRKWYWFAAIAATVGLLTCTLMRGDAIAGVLLFAGVALARLRHRGWIYGFIAALVLVYGFGSASWVLLRELGIGSFAPKMDVSNIAAVVGAGAPDVSDHLQFFTAWLNHPEYTWGRTFVGGLVPSHFAWNPAVWTLMVEQPGTPLNSISSGGLRLPGPLWGYVSFAWPGVILVSALSGVVMGFAGAAVRRAVTLKNREQALFAVVLYAAVIAVVGQFYTLNYSSAFELLVLIAIAAIPAAAVLRRRAAKRDRSA